LSPEKFRFARGARDARAAARGATGRFHAVGIGGDEMRAAGVELVEHVEQLAVMGFIEVLQHVPRHWALLRSLERRIKSGNVAPSF
jgi:lipid A disaccharide synthetase